RRAVTAVEPALPGSPPNLRRQVFEVPAGSEAAAIQAVVSAAFGQNGQRPIVHFSHGTYQIAETITIPASDLQIVGDGYGTILQWTGSGAGPVIRVRGPSQVTLREIQVAGAGR